MLCTDLVINLPSELQKPPGSSQAGVSRDCTEECDSRMQQCLGAAPLFCAYRDPPPEDSDGEHQEPAGEYSQNPLVPIHRAEY